MWPLVAGAGTLGGAGKVASKTGLVQIIDADYRGVRLRRGQPGRVDLNDSNIEKNLYGAVRPGLRTHLPFVRNILLVNIMNRRAYISTPVDCRDGKQRNEGAQVIWGVKPEPPYPFRAIFKPARPDVKKGEPDTEPLKEIAEGIFTGAFRSVMEEVKRNPYGRPIIENEFDQEGNLLDEDAVLQKRMVEKCAGRLLLYGCEIREFSLVEDARSLGQFIVEGWGPQHNSNGTNGANGREPMHSEAGKLAVLTEIAPELGQARASSS
jgi:hypothetical protein